MTTTLESAPSIFAQKVEFEGLEQFLTAVKDQTTMQLNITKNCNLSCKHCHVGSGPARLEEMDKATLQACLDVFAAGPFTSMDITGGAPELNTHYRWFIAEAARLASEKRARGLETRIITRSNAVIVTQPGYEDLPELWASLGVEVAVSLPHYEERKTNSMRGEGVFEFIIVGLRALNAVGYGKQDGSGLVMNIVVNPGGAVLPGSQASLEREFKKALSERFDISFDNLLVIANNPVGRFKSFLESRNLYDAYLDKLMGAFNPATVAGAMCRDQISVDVDGKIYDCDFNQIVELPVLQSCHEADYASEDADGNLISAVTIYDLARDGLGITSERKIRVGEHCFACTAGAGSSCGGSTA